MQSCAGDLLNQLNVEQIENLSMRGQTNLIHAAFLKPKASEG